MVWIMQLRTGHCHLNQYLHRLNIIEISECECGGGKETVDHFFPNCELFDEEQDRLRRVAGVQGVGISTLLGDMEIIRETVEHYIERTRRFEFNQR